MVIYIWWYIFAGRAKKKINFTFSQIPGRQNIILYILLFNTLDSQKSIFPHFPNYCKNLFSACAKLFLCSGLSLFAVLRPKNRTKRCNSLWDKHFPRFPECRSLLWGQILLWWQEWVLSSYAVCTSTARFCVSGTWCGLLFSRPGVAPDSSSEARQRTSPSRS